jgi:hypothetical protein
METPPSVQQLFFQHIKERLDGHLSLVNEIADLLNISNDSAYRRIRGEKAVSIDELRILCSHFRISLDQLFHLQSNNILFWGKFINNADFNFDLYLKDMLQLLLYFNSFVQKELMFISKDIPPYHLFNFPELAAFKSFFWMKTILQYPAYAKRHFLIEELMGSTAETCNRIIHEYNKIPSQEIWHAESIHATIRQIDYYKDARVFASSQDLATIYESLHKTIDHIEAQVERGCKFPVQGQQLQTMAPLKFYINEFVLGDNTFLVHLNGSRMVLLNHSVLNVISTKDEFFTQCTNDHFENVIRKSTQISGVGEKERSKFFNVLREKIEVSRKN